MAVVKSLNTLPLYSRILSKFPEKYISFCFAYGSGVKKQLNDINTKCASSNMIDLIYCVNDSQAFHEDNLRNNSSHYSGLKYMGQNFIAKFQENSGAKVYFNTLVSLEDDILIKYGVVSSKDLITDLLEWSNLYLAGRLHKPVEFVIKPNGFELQSALQLNLQSAVHAALLILPESFSEYEFYYTISNLSYGGDFRMIFGENKNKVKNIVSPQLLAFRNLYNPIISKLYDYCEFSNLTVDPNERNLNCCQDVSPLSKLHHLNQLPRWPQKALTRTWNRGKYCQDTEDVLRAVAYDSDSNILVQQCINEIVWKSSISQSLKGILTAGLLKSIKYGGRKILKMFK